MIAAGFSVVLEDRELPVKVRVKANWAVAVLIGLGIWSFAFKIVGARNETFC